MVGFSTPGRLLAPAEAIRPERGTPPATGRLLSANGLHVQQIFQFRLPSRQHLPTHLTGRLKGAALGNSLWSNWLGGIRNSHIPTAPPALPRATG